MKRQGVILDGGVSEISVRLGGFTSYNAKALPLIYTLNATNFLMKTGSLHSWHPHAMTFQMFLEKSKLHPFFVWITSRVMSSRGFQKVVLVQQLRYWMGISLGIYLPLIQR